MASQEKEDKENQRRAEEFRKELSQLSAWDLYQVDLYAKWLAFRLKLRRLALKWLIFQ